ncbi:MAG TPA: tautomerase family protein [Paraburkholderia sp.]|jgi:4-oxalocrotonate tautomerase|nr:tautomerase family protein [Paraburkholderia sp.]
MPFVNVKIAGPTLAPEQIGRLQRDITDIMADALGKDPAVTSVLVEQVAARGCSIAGTAVHVLAHINARITAGINTADQKARFIADAHTLLKRILGGGLPVATYVIVDEVAADAWGYDGVTQQHRAAPR